MRFPLARTLGPLGAAAGVPLPPLNLVFEGDSLTQVKPDGTHDWPSYFVQLLTADGYTVTSRTAAVSGSTMDGVNGSDSVMSRAAADDALLSTTPGVLNFIVLLDGFNDQGAGESLATIEGNVASWAAARAAAGWAVVMATQLANWNDDTSRQTYDSWLKANYTRIFDLGAEGNIGTYGRYIPPWTNENVHPNDNGCRVMAAQAYIGWRSFMGLPKTTVVTSFYPAQANTGTVDVYGTGFTGASAVAFGGTAPASYTVLSDTHIQATLGAGATGTVSVTSPSGTGTSLVTFTYSATPQATITSVAPHRTTGRFATNAGDDPGDVLDVTGTNLASVTSVTFPGPTTTRISGVDLNSSGPTLFFVRVPEDATLESGFLSADCGINGVATAAWTRSAAAPVLDSSPYAPIVDVSNNPKTSVPVGTTNLFLNGQHVCQPPVGVTVGGLSAPNTAAWGDDQVIFDIPPALTAGTYTVTITTANGSASTTITLT